jgi:hypothetical protein
MNKGEQKIQMRQTVAIIRSRAGNRRKMPAETTLSTPEAPWRAPEIADRASFLIEHPECLVTEDLLNRLMVDIHRRAAAMARDDDELELEDVESEIVAGLFECATHFRRRDAAGQPIFDFLAQQPTYIVRHAAGSVSSELRRQRVRAHHTFSYDTPIEASGDDADEGDELFITLADSKAGFSTDRLELRELAAAVDERLRTDPVLRRDPTIRQVWSLFLTGHDRADIGALLGLRRQRVHERCLRLRPVIAEFDPAYAMAAL